MLYSGFNQPVHLGKQRAHHGLPAPSPCRRVGHYREEISTLAVAVKDENNSQPFMSFDPDFDWRPEGGSMLEECLDVNIDQALIPAGPGFPDRTGFRLWGQTVNIQDVTLTLIGPANVNSVTFWYWRRGLKDWDPFWARPWPSGLALADQILRNPELVRGKQVIELGAGVGAPGIAAVLSGARDVFITDREPLSLECTALSARAHGLEAQVHPAAGHRRDPAAGGDVPALSGTNDRMDGLSPQGVVSCVLLDWSLPVVPAELVGRFDVVLATDVLYEHFSVPMVAKVVSQLVRRKPIQSSTGTKVPACLLLAEFRDRYPTNLAAFQSLMQAPSSNMRLSSIHQEICQMPSFTNEMLDIALDPENPQIKVDFLTFTVED